MIHTLLQSSSSPARFLPSRWTASCTPPAPHVLRQGGGDGGDVRVSSPSAASCERDTRLAMPGCSRRVALFETQELGAYVHILRGCRHLTRSLCHERSFMACSGWTAVSEAFRGGGTRRKRPRADDDEAAAVFAPAIFRGVKRAVIPSNREATWT
ncbi:hypothetical protein MTO96_019147 [Rhipicephalus appendiculatus]